MRKVSHLLKSINKENMMQFIKFGLVGVSNTAISYGVEMLGFYVLFQNAAWNSNVKIFVVSLIAFVVSVSNSYYWNSRFVFNSNSGHTMKFHVVRYLKTFLCYGMTGLVLSPILKMILQGLGIPYWLTSILVLIISVPLNYIMNKLWAFNEGTSAKEPAK